MSAWPDEPDHFAEWLDRHAVETFDGFAPRLAFGRYLGDVLAAAEVRVESNEVVDLVPGRPARVSLDDGRVLAADVVVLATGRPAGTMPEPLCGRWPPCSATQTGPSSRMRGHRARSGG